LLESYGYHQTMRTLTDLIGEQAPRDKTIVLIHFSHTAKHWVVWHDSDERGLLFHWGDGTIRHLPYDDAVDAVTRSFPNCIYTPTLAPPRLSWWQRVRRWVLEIIARWT